ncbi:MAG TPA: MauE/DoxX family redox-associated membrane protein [Dehalococcoidia bacterium]|nr:MauE/DoxX family redox-associated membrane protein [Dehalococcoidia bacterium]
MQTTAERHEARGARRAIPWRRVLHVALRLVLGLTLLGMATGTALDIPGFRDVLRGYDVFPGWALWPIAIVLPVSEAFGAVTLLTGWRLRTGIGVSSLLQAGWAALLMLALRRGVEIHNVGWFGVFWAQPLSWTGPLAALALLAISAGVLVTLPSGPVWRCSTGG